MLREKKLLGIDVRDLEEGWAGRKRYTESLLRALSMVDEVNEYILFSRRRGDFGLAENFRTVSIDTTPAFWHYKVAQFCREKGIDIYISPRSPITISLLRNKTIYVVHDLIVFTSEGRRLPLKSRIVEKVFMRKALRRADLIVAVSENTKRDILHHVNLPEEKVKVIYEAPAPIFRRMKPDHSILSRYDLRKNFILYVGTIEPRKNLKLLVDAYKMLPESVRDEFMLVFVGKKGWDYGEVLKYADENLGAYYFRFLGYVPDEDLVHIYNAAHIFVYPSFYEGFGLPVLEAMSCGVPVIVSKVSSLPEIVGDNGILIDPSDACELETALERLLDNEELRKGLSTRALKRSLDFSWEKAARKFVELYSAL